MSDPVKPVSAQGSASYYQELEQYVTALEAKVKTLFASNEVFGVAVVAFVLGFVAATIF